MNEEIRRNRKLMRSDFGVPEEPSDQRKGLPQPPLQKEPPDDARKLKLPSFDDLFFVVERKCLRMGLALN